MNLKTIKSAYRRTWGAISPVTRIVPNKKLYKRSREKGRFEAKERS